jgi:hypothetical protein
MMMKKSNFYYWFAFLLFMGFSARAQDFAIGVRGGFSIPNLSAGANNSNPLNTGYSSRTGADAGVFAEFKFSDLFSLQPMVEYSSQGGKKDGLQAFPNPQGNTPPYLYANYNSTAKLNYLMVPVLAKFGWNLGKTSPFRLYVDAGPFAGFLLSAHQVTTGNSDVYADAGGTQPASPGPESFNNNQNIKDQLHTLNFGAEANVGLKYKLGTSSIFIEGGGNYGFLNIQKGTANGKNETGAATADIGYAYGFGKTK